MTATVGRCGNTPTYQLPGTPQLVCVLPSGHAGWHGDGSSNWGRPWMDSDAAPDLSRREAGVMARFGLRPDAPESLRERVAAALAAEDQRSLLSGPLGWPETQRRWPDACGKYRATADAVIAVVTESALR